jgi:hypothetical protein
MLLPFFGIFVRLIGIYAFRGLGHNRSHSGDVVSAVEDNAANPPMGVGGVDVRLLHVEAAEGGPVYPDVEHGPLNPYPGYLGHVQVTSGISNPILLAQLLKEHRERFRDGFGSPVGDIHIDSWKVYPFLRFVHVGGFGVQDRPSSFSIILRAYHESFG